MNDAWKIDGITDIKRKFAASIDGNRRTHFSLLLPEVVHVTLINCCKRHIKNLMPEKKINKEEPKDATLPISTKLTHVEALPSTQETRRKKKKTNASTSDSPTGGEDTKPRVRTATQTITEPQSKKVKKEKHIQCKLCDYKTKYNSNILRHIYGRHQKD